MEGKGGLNCKTCGGVGHLDYHHSVVPPSATVPQVQQGGGAGGGQVAQQGGGGQVSVPQNGGRNVYISQGGTWTNPRPAQLGEDGLRKECPLWSRGTCWNHEQCTFCHDGLVPKTGERVRPAIGIAPPVVPPAQKWSDQGTAAVASKGGGKGSTSKGGSAGDRQRSVDKVWEQDAWKTWNKDAPSAAGKGKGKGDGTGKGGVRQNQVYAPDQEEGEQTAEEQIGDFGAFIEEVEDDDGGQGLLQNTPVFQRGMRLAESGASQVRGRRVPPSPSGTQLVCGKLGNGSRQGVNQVVESTDPQMMAMLDRPRIEERKLVFKRGKKGDPRELSVSRRGLDVPEPGGASGRRSRSEPQLVRPGDMVPREESSVSSVVPDCGSSGEI